MAHPVLWFEVMGTNGETLRSFYSALFNWTFKVDGPMQYGVASTGDERGIPGGVGHAGEGNKPYGPTFYVETPDVAASLADAERLGGKTMMPPTGVGGDMRIGLVSDPEGHVIGLIQRAAA